jgi:hypothetical protein
MNDQNFTLQLKIKIGLTTKNLRRIRRHLIKSKFNIPYETSLKLILWMALIIHNLNQYSDVIILEEKKKNPLIPKHKISKPQKLSKAKVKMLIKKVGRSKSVGKEVKPKQITHLEKYKEAWTLEPIKWEHKITKFEKLDWWRFRQAMEYNQKIKIPENEDDLPEYLMNSLNLEGSYFSQKNADRISIRAYDFLDECDYTAQWLIYEMSDFAEAKHRKGGCNPKFRSEWKCYGENLVGSVEEGMIRREAIKKKFILRLKRAQKHEAEVKLFN